MVYHLKRRCRCHYLDGQFGIRAMLSPHDDSPGVVDVGAGARVRHSNSPNRPAAAPTGDKARGPGAR